MPPANMLSYQKMMDDMGQSVTKGVTGPGSAMPDAYADNYEQQRGAFFNNNFDRTLANLGAGDVDDFLYQGMALGLPAWADQRQRMRGWEPQEGADIAAIRNQQNIALANLRGNAGRYDATEYQRQAAMGDAIKAQLAARAQAGGRPVPGGGLQGFGDQSSMIAARAAQLGAAEATGSADIYRRALAQRRAQELQNAQQRGAAFGGLEEARGRWQDLGLQDKNSQYAGALDAFKLVQEGQQQHEQVSRDEDAKRNQIIGTGLNTVGALLPFFS